MRLITIIITILLLFAISCNQQLQDNKDLNNIKPEPQQDYKANTQPIAKPQPKQELPKVSEEKTKEPEISKHDNIEAPKKQSSTDQSVVGVWRPHAQSIEYDAGAINSIKKPVTRKLTISSDGTWEYGSTGTWEVELIEEKDWERWKMASYGPTKKIVLHGWNNAIGDGPIDEGTAGVDFIWVIYRSEKLSLGPATISIKFGH